MTDEYLAGVELAYATGFVAPLVWGHGSYKLVALPDDGCGNGAEYCVRLLDRNGNEYPAGRLLAGEGQWFYITLAEPFGWLEVTG